MKIKSIPNMACLALAMAFCGSIGAQQIFKCKNAAGNFEFTDAPCSGTGAQIRARTNSIDSSGSRELLLRQENERLKEQLQQQKIMSPSNTNTAPQRTQPDLQSERIDAIACERAKRDYEVTANASSNSDKPAIVEAKRSMMYGTCGMREPNKNTTNVNVDVNNRILIR